MPKAIGKNDRNIPGHLKRNDRVVHILCMCTFAKHGGVLMLCFETHRLEAVCAIRGWPETLCFDGRLAVLVAGSPNLPFGTIMAVQDADPSCLAERFLIISIVRRG